LFLKTDGAGNLSFASLSFATPLAVVGDNVAGASIRLPEDTDNGSNYVAIKAPDNLASNLTLTLPSADGTSGQVLQTNGSGVLSFSSPSAGAFVFLAETSASNVASVDLNGYFTSSYDVYKVFIDGIYGSAAAQTLLRFATTGSYTVQTTSYYAQSQYAYGDGTTFLSNESQNWNGNGFNITPNISTTSANTSSVELTIYNPMSSTNQVTVTGNHTTAKGNYEWIGTGTCGGRWNSTTAVTGIRFLMASGNIYARKIRLYGIKNS